MPGKIDSEQGHQSSEFDPEAQQLLKSIAVLAKKLNYNNQVVREFIELAIDPQRKDEINGSKAEQAAKFFEFCQAKVISSNKVKKLFELLFPENSASTLTHIDKIYKVFAGKSEKSVKDIITEYPEDSMHQIFDLTLDYWLFLERVNDLFAGIVDAMQSNNPKPENLYGSLSFLNLDEPLQEAGLDSSEYAQYLTLRVDQYFVEMERSAIIDLAIVLYAITFINEYEQFLS